jgi:Spy/CpxP family protein refolding chaperone
MNATRKILAALTLASSAAFVALPALAHPDDCMGGGMGGHGRMSERMGERMKQHEQRVHDALKLSPEQEKAWAKFQESQPWGKMANHPSFADMEKLSAPERADKMLEFQRQHQEAMTKHVAAMKEFYGQLTPEQKKIFDEQSMPQRRGGGMGPRGPGARAPGAGGPGPAPAPTAK